MPARPARKLAAVRRPRATGKSTRKPTPAPGATPTLGPGWSNYDPMAALVEIELAPGVWFLMMRLKVSDASKASWGTLAFAARPDLTRPDLPCAVHDASSGKIYPAMATISSTGAVSITNIGTGSGGAMTAPFAIGRGDMVNISFVYCIL